MSKKTYRRKKTSHSVASILETWKKKSGRFSNTDEPSPVYWLKGIPINVISRHIWNYKNYSDIESLWDQKEKPKFEASTEYTAVKHWLEESVLPRMSAQGKEKLLRSPLTEVLRDAEVSTSIACGLLPKPPLDYYDFRQALYNHNRAWRITKKEVEDVLSYAHEYRARKKVIVYTLLQELGFHVMEIIESQTTHSCYFHIEGYKKPVRLSEHPSREKNAYCCTLLLQHPNENIRQGILVSLQQKAHT